MASVGITVTTALLCLMLGILSPAPAECSSVNAGCCTMFNRKRVPFPHIKGYKEQTKGEHCHFDAIIFITEKDREICATKEDKWVRITLKLLSSKLNNMSKASPDETGPVKKKPGNTEPRETLKNNSIISTTEASLNSTESFEK